MLKTLGPSQPGHSMVDWEVRQGAYEWAASDTQASWVHRLGGWSCEPAAHSRT